MAALVGNSLFVLKSLLNKDCQCVKFFVIGLPSE